MELTGKEGEVVSESVFESLVKTYQGLHGKDATFLKYSTVGIDQLKEAMVPGAVAFRVYNGSDGNEEKFLFIPVDAEGNELELPEGKALRDDPPHCPPQCR